MGERKGVNKYYPPDFDPAKHRSINGYWKTHPLRERARKLSQGILIIRFEMPYNIWCDGCKNHIGMGVRYNAEKKKVGNYYTTPIYRFRMKCHLCVNYIEMQTDPATCDYVIVSGASRKEERWNMTENEQILTTEHSEKEKLETDPMYKLEHGGKDREKLRAAIPSLTEIQQRQARWKDDFDLHCCLRKKFREEKKAKREEEEKDNTVRKRMCLSIPLVPEKNEDKKLASLLTFQSPDSYEDRQHTKRQQISSRSWFSPSSSTPTGSAVGRLLNKLGQKGRGATAAKALKTTPGSSLVRRRSDGGGGGAIIDDASLTACSTQESVSCPNIATLDSKNTDSSSIQCLEDRHETCRPSTEERAGKPFPEVHCETEGHSSTQTCSASSLVPDYSDSDSD
ncbi:probable splicing factor YJU2B [Neoarius graeffei]|uniref:probable splicing factor YJU2B n=1 Tax=Neoarius graeffei TaxID=443677 RepID=UPI00298D23B3|nr:probable splicing factor YJU2B [Neoarius graeffei]XP_060767360.1 probable splicing factor YJU2B [Neoarius graeffei]XP_060767362.1 probable splicing factor YJU2B [Neoarius graeffei]